MAATAQCAAADAADWLRWLLEEGYELPLGEVVRAAARAENADILHYLASMGHRLPWEALLGGAEGGQVVVLELPVSLGCPMDVNSVLEAAVAESHCGDALQGSPD
ncbi:hypothetical protein GPECTOR_2g1129 [Gonium pectorale]|uniref:Uncharacterized protein n=1 Tax=Gonium pectorale TaxID=33097 RepID=A0A150H1W8_GONPE|nr:hypothetical protein GPECTOR_2g1129 [Gonium pectorale]|eukprot:KXZ55580.1 hypothetical protein GPECTOR_2g1129 [Gonium pectorale]